MRWFFALSAVSALGLATSCHKSDALGEKLSTVLGFCDEWATRACNDTVVKLCAAASTNACIETQQAFCESLIPDGKYSAATAGDCVAAVEAAYKDGVLTADERDTVTALGNACDKILSGTGTAGKSCSVDSDCNRDEGLSCVKKTSPTGKCETPASPPVGGGEACDAAEAVCVDGFYCDGMNCLAAKKEGADCSSTVPCNADSRCLDADGKAVSAAASADGGAATGTCSARSVNGSSCKTDDDCTSRICSPRAGSDTGVCSAQISLSPSDPMCTNLQ